MTATPRPWQLKYGVPTVILPPDTVTRKAAIADFALSHGLGEAGQEDEDNAALALLAVNSHDAMLEALKAVREALDAHARGSLPSLEDTEDVVAAAIKLAEGETWRGQQ